MFLNCWYAVKSLSSNISSSYPLHYPHIHLLTVIYYVICRKRDGQSLYFVLMTTKSGMYRNSTVSVVCKEAMESVHINQILPRDSEWLCPETIQIVKIGNIARKKEMMKKMSSEFAF